MQHGWVGLFLFMKSKIFSGIFREFLFIAGIGLLGHGLYLYQPWVSYTVVGAVLLFIGLLSALRG
jgi:hypothetical protein